MFSQYHCQNMFISPSNCWWSPLLLGVKMCSWSKDSSAAARMTVSHMPCNLTIVHRIDFQKCSSPIKVPYFSLYSNKKYSFCRIWIVGQAPKLPASLQVPIVDVYPPYNPHRLDENHWIGRVNFDRKPLYLMGKTLVFCKCSLKNQSREKTLK